MSGEPSASHVPPGSTCHVIDYSSQYGDVAACVPEEGLIILRDGRVIGWCDIGEGRVKRISILFTYQPFCKNYVLQLASSVKVVSHASCLKVSHTFENVTRFEIGDFSHKGSPQLGLWSKGSDAMRIADLIESSSSSVNPNPVETVLLSKLRGLKVSVERVCKQLGEKKKLRQHCMFHIVGINQSIDSPSLDKLIPLIGSSSNSKVNQTTSRCSVVVKNVWQKLLDRKWILGCDVQNTSCGPLSALSLCASEAADGADGVVGTVQWRVMVQQPRSKAGATANNLQQPWPPWTVLPADGVLEAGQLAVIVATVPEPSFLGRSAVVEVRGLLSAVLPDGRETWVGLPPWRLSVGAVLRGDLVPFVRPLPLPRPEHEDVLASAACCPVAVELVLEGRDGLPERVARLLEEADVRSPDAADAADPADAAEPATAAALVGGRSLLVGCGPPETPLHGALVLLHALAANACSLHARLRDARHVFLLAHHLKAGLPQHTTLRAVEPRRHRDADAGALLKALSAEVRGLADAGAGRRLPRAALHALEVDTDLAALALSGCR